MSLLEVEGLRVRLPMEHGHVTVVDGVAYAVEPGEVFGVAGESGSGKTMSRGRFASAAATCCGSRESSFARSPAASWRWSSRTR